jgi:bacterioferritin-associated ferredoxin
MYEEKEELISIIKQAAKERLTMEKQLAKIKPVSTHCNIGGCRGHDRMVVGFTTTCAISVYHH